MRVTRHVGWMFGLSAAAGCNSVTTGMSDIGAEAEAKGVIGSCVPTALDLGWVGDATVNASYVIANRSSKIVHCTTELFVSPALPVHPEGVVVGPIAKQSEVSGAFELSTALAAPGTYDVQVCSQRKARESSYPSNHCLGQSLVIEAGGTTTPTEDTGASLEAIAPGSVTRTAASCSQPHVQAALDLASSGETVGIPAGECTWSTKVELDAETRDVHLVGAGRDQTIIHANASTTLSIQGGKDHAWTVSAITFLDGIEGYIIGIGGESTRWRFFDVDFRPNGNPYAVFDVYGSTYGVIHDVSLVGTTPSEMIQVNDTNWTSWQRPITWGGSDALYLEDVTISWTDRWEGRPVIDPQEGARVVLRHSDVTNSITGGHGFDSGRGAGQLHVEVYGNTFHITDDMDTWAFLGHHRGGTGVFFDNTFDVGTAVWLGNVIDLETYRQIGGVSSWDACDGTALRFCSNVTKDWVITAGDMPATCKSDADCSYGDCRYKLCSASRTVLCESDSDCPGSESCSSFVDGPGGDPCFMQIGYGANMQPEPWYEWNNVLHGSDNASDEPDVDFGSGSPGIDEGEEYHNDTVKPGYTAYSYPHPLRP